MYRADNNKITRYFVNLDALSEFMGYTPAYLSQKVRMGYPIEGFYIEKLNAKESQKILDRLKENNNG